MNIEIANRLVKLRKDKNLSQEALANELGISRQAVSKWERAESSPDTDNLILLAQLYGMSLDELLSTNQKKFESGETYEEPKEEKQKDDNKEYVHISLKEGIHVKEKNGDEVHVGWSGIHVKESKSEDGKEVHIDGNGVYVDGKQYGGDWKQAFGHDDEYEYKKEFPIVVLVTVAYIFLGIEYNAWHPGWLLFGIIPIFHSIISAFRHRNIMRFAYPVAVLMFVEYFGFMEGTWYPYWLSILTIPVFYSVFGYLTYKIKGDKYKEY
ncbi:MAG: helix-turn-helix transcriptional regulator [Coprobacillaceae bacterium]